MKKIRKKSGDLAATGISTSALFQPVQVKQTIFSEDGIELIHLWSCGEGVEICRDDEEDVFHIRLQENTQEVPHSVVTLASPDGKLLTEHTFDDCDDFQDGLLCVYSEGKGYGYIDLNGKLVIPPQYEETEDFYNNCAAVKKGGQWRLIDRNGREIALERNYQKFGAMENGRCPASMVQFKSDDFAYYSDYECYAGWWGYVDETGKEVIPPQYIYATEFQDGLAVVCKGEWTKSPEWDNEYKKGGYWFAEEHWGVIDPDGNEVIPCQYDIIDTLSESEVREAFKVHAGGWDDGKWGVMDKCGKWLAPPIFDRIEDYYRDEHLVIYVSWDLAMEGVFDIKTQKILFEFPEIEPLPNGLFLVTKTTQNGRETQHIYDRTGKEIFPSDYQCIDTETIPYIVSKRSGDVLLHGLINPDGSEILPCKYKNLHWRYSPIRENPNFVFEEKGKFGIIDFSGRILLPAKYEVLWNLTDQWFYFEDENGAGIVSVSGKTASFTDRKYRRIDKRPNKYIIARHNGGTDIFAIRKSETGRA